MHPEKQHHELEPKIVAFVCTWCTYAGADLAGTWNWTAIPMNRSLP
ncbi:hydrogenase iron-sulfur subunit [Geotalea daltonii]